MTVIHHDFETYSEIDLKTAGVYKYAMHPSTEVLMLAWTVQGEGPRLWVPAEGEPLPVDLEHLIADPNALWHAFNSQFERLIWWHVMPRLVQSSLDFHIPINRFRCTMTHAWSCSFAGGLAQVGQQVGLPQDKKKNSRGTKLIHKFCKPAPRNHIADRYTHENAPEDWAEFKGYCLQDVVAERAIEDLLARYPMPAQELDLWFWDQEVNDRGVPIDLDLVGSAVKMEERVKREMRAEMNSITFLENANSNPQLMGWLHAQGVMVSDMQAETLRQVVKRVDDPLVKQVLTYKLATSKTSTSKWSAFQKATGDDGMLRGMFSFAGAQRTQRWAGRVVQLHNLKRPSTAHPDLDAELLFEDLDIVETLYGSPMSLLSETIRCAITAPEGHRLTPCDLGSIESRVLGYMSCCTRMNKVFADGRDTYRDFATELYACAYDEVTSAQRTYCKPPVLGCGYQLGGKGLVEYAEGMGVSMSEEEANKAVATWRATYPEVKPMWYWLIDSCKDVIENWTTHEGYCVRIRRDNNFLFIDLPSGRSLHYYCPLVTLQIPPWERELVDAGLIDREDADVIPTMSYLGMNKSWDHIFTHGGKITENIDQAMSRDILAFHMREIEKELGPIIRGHVHDEAIPLVPEAVAEQWLSVEEEIMCLSPPWAPSLKLGAKGFVTKRYKKE